MDVNNPLKMVLIGIDPYPYLVLYVLLKIPPKFLPISGTTCDRFLVIPIPIRFLSVETTA